MHKDLFGHKSTFDSRQRAIEFIFCDESADDTFEVCCEVLGCRIDVLRLRFQYEFWLRWLTFAEPFPFAVCSLPEIVQAQVMMCGGFEGVYLAQEAWHQPGISTEVLLSRASGGHAAEAVLQRFLQSLYLMEERFLISQNAGLWYFTGRNPTQARLEFARASGYDVQKGGSIYWSALFPTF